MTRNMIVLMMKKGPTPMSVSLIECDCLSTRAKYQRLERIQMPVTAQPCQATGRQRVPSNVFLNHIKSSMIGLAGIEPALHDPQPCVLPLYYSPQFRRGIYEHTSPLSFGPPGIEPGLHEPESCVQPVYYGPFVRMVSDFLNTHK